MAKAPIIDGNPLFIAQNAWNELEWKILKRESEGIPVSNNSEELTACHVRILNLEGQVRDLQHQVSDLTSENKRLRGFICKNIEDTLKNMVLKA